MEHLTLLILKKGNWFFEEDIDIRNKNKNIEYKEPDLGLTPK